MCVCVCVFCGRCACWFVDGVWVWVWVCLLVCVCVCVCLSGFHQSPEVSMSACSEGGYFSLQIVWLVFVTNSIPFGSWLSIQPTKGSLPECLDHFGGEQEG